MPRVSQLRSSRIGKSAQADTRAPDREVNVRNMKNFSAQRQAQRQPHFRCRENTSAHLEQWPVGRQITQAIQVLQSYREAFLKGSS